MKIKRTFVRVYMLMMLVALGLMACMPAAPAAPPVSTRSPAAQGLMLVSAPRLQGPTATPDLPATLPVPTPVPASANAQATPRPTVSALQRIRDEGVLRAGVLYNSAPMSSLSERGVVVGYEADLARAIAADWDVEVQFVQVTRQNAVAMLLAGEVDILMASIVHRRDAENELAFSHTYFAGGQYFVVTEDSPIQTVEALSGLRVGLAQGTASERALGQAISRGRLNVIPELYLTSEQAIGALGSGEVSAILADRVQMISMKARVSTLRSLDQPLESEPFAVAYRRYDDPLGYMLDRSLQRAYADGTFDNLRRTWFPSVTFSMALPVWEDVDEDERVLADFDTTLPYPESVITSRILNGQSIRVAGLSLDPQLSGLNAILEQFYRALIENMAARWGTPVEFVPGSAANASDLVASGQAELAIGVAPRWIGPFEVAFSAPLIAHGDRLMVTANSDIEGFTDLRGGRWVGIFASEPGAADRVNALAESVNTAVNIFTIINDGDAVYSLTVEQNVDVVFGDSLRLLSQVASSAESVRLTERWYSNEYFAIAMQRRDPNLRSLVEVTLQQMAKDGTFERLWMEHLTTGEVQRFEQWPGTDGSFMGVNLSATP
jgi:ABC-type amino acid transport substrate-binding protein